MTSDLIEEVICEYLCVYVYECMIGTSIISVLLLHQ